MHAASRTEWGGPAEAPGHPTSGAKLLVVAHHAHRPHLNCGETRKREREAMLGMARYHSEKGWGEGTGYNFAGFQSGNAYEGRGWGRVGAHTEGRNSSSYGYLFVIDGEAHAPTQAAIETFREWLAEGKRLGHLAPNVVIAPHDRFKNKVCPGQLVKDSGILTPVGIPIVERAAAVAPLPTLRIGSGGKAAAPDLYEAVRELQRRLGMPAHLRTGYYGELTEAVVKDWQRARGLKADGIIGPKSWALLN